MADDSSLSSSAPRSSAAYTSSRSLHVSMSDLDAHARAAADEAQSAMAAAFAAAQAAFVALERAPLPDAIAQQQRVRDTLVQVLTLHYRVQQCNLFSANEELDDVSTGDLKYALLPFFLGDLCLKITDDSRDAHLRASTRFYLTFLRQCANFKILSPPDWRAYEQIEAHVRKSQRGALDSSSSSSASSSSVDGDEPAPALTDPHAERNEKLERLRRKKDAEKQLEAAVASLTARIRKLGADAADEQADDDESERAYLRIYLAHAVLASIDNCRMSARELDVLAMRPQYERILRAEARDGGAPPPPDKPKVMRIEPRANGPAVVSANFAVDSGGNMVKQSGGARGDGAVRVGGMRLVPLSTAIDIRTQYASRVFRDFNPPTMDEAEYMRVLEARGFFAHAHGGGSAGEAAAEAAARDRARDLDDDDEAHDADTRKKRDWDNWKDDNPKGAGNRMNK